MLHSAESRSPSRERRSLLGLMHDPAAMLPAHLSQNTAMCPNADFARAADWLPQLSTDGFRCCSVNQWSDNTR